MSEQRRLSVSSPARRRRRAPAYQVRRNTRQTTPSDPANEVPPDAQDDPANDAAGPVDEVAPETQEPVETPEASTNGTEAMPVTEATRPSTGTEAMPAVEPVSSAPPSSDDAIIDIPATTHAEPPVDVANPEPSSTVDDGDFADYARSVEEAAARSRLEMAPQAAATAAYPAVQPRVVAAPAVGVRPSRRQTRGRPVVGSRVRGGNGGGGGGRGHTTGGNRERDPRPLLKRPRTWFVIFGILVAIIAIAAVLWAANIVRLTYNAHNEAHVDVGERPVYTVNPQGTPEVVPTEEVEASLPDWDNRDPFNVLLMGIDDRDGDTEPPRSDTIIVMRVNPATNHIAMMSIPRDLLVYIPIADRWDKINAAYPIGEERKEGEGPSAVMQTIEANFDVRVHYFVTVDFEGFRSIVDTVGGVIIDVPAPVKDDQYPTENFGLTRAYFPTGLQKMDGETALRYSRTRHGDNDIARGDRQQQMLIALREQAMNLGLITEAEELIRQFGSMVKYNFNFNQLLALANLGRSVDPNAISRVNLWDAGVLSEHAVEGDPFYFEADWPAVYQLMDVYFNNTSDDPVPPTPTIAVPGDSSGSPVAGLGVVDLDIPIIVQNNAGIGQLATAVSGVMYDVGFSIVTAETGGGVQDVTMIYDYAESPETAQYIARQLGLDESSIVYGNGGNGIVVELGSDVAWVLDQ